MTRRAAWIVIFVVLFYLGYDWAVRPFFRLPGGLGDGVESHLIESRYPYHLVDPTWLGNDERVIGLIWPFVETVARLAVFALCVLGLFLYCRIKTSGHPPQQRPTVSELFIQPANKVATGFWKLITTAWRLSRNWPISPRFRQFLGAVFVLLSVLLMATLVSLIFWFGLWNSFELSILALGGGALMVLFRRESAHRTKEISIAPAVLFVPLLAAITNSIIPLIYLNGLSFNTPLDPNLLVTLINAPCWFIFLFTGQFIALRLSQNRPGRLILAYVAALMIFMGATAIVMIIGSWNTGIFDATGHRLDFLAKLWNRIQMAGFIVPYSVRDMLPSLAINSVLLLLLRKKPWW